MISSRRGTRPVAGGRIDAKSVLQWRERRMGEGREAFSENKAGRETRTIHLVEECAQDDAVYRRGGGGAEQGTLPVVCEEGTAHHRALHNKQPSHLWRAHTASITRTSRHHVDVAASRVGHAP